MSSSRSRNRGFTLLEVMVALTITGLALGGLFAVIGGSKRLAWRAEDALVRATQVRSMINFSQLNDERGEVFMRLQNDALSLATGTGLETPERKTSATNEELRGYEITDAEGEVIAQGTYWMFPEFPEVPPNSGGNGNDSTDPLGLRPQQEGPARARPPANVPSLGIRGIPAGTRRQNPTGSSQGSRQ